MSGLPACQLPRHMSVRRAVLDLLILFLVLPTTHAALVNYTIDDTYGDSVTGAKPVYLPASPWAGPGCTGCAIAPNKSLAFDGTWTAATYNPSLFNNMNITFSFTGISIWVFFILANNNTLGPGITSNTQCNFTLDGQLAGNFNHQPDESTYALQYNATAFSASGLSNSQHELVISTNDLPISAFLNFDYAIYTADLPDSATISSSGTAAGSSSGTATGGVSIISTTSKPSSSSNSNLGIIIGCVLGGLALIVLALVFVLFRRLQKKQKAPTQQPISAFNREPPRSYRGDPAMSDSHLPWQSSVYPDSPSQGLMSGSTGAFHDPPSHFRSPSSDLGSDATTLVPVRREYQPLHAHSTKSRDELRAVRQMDINQRLQNAQREIHNLTSRQTTSSGPGSSISDAGRQETGHEMETMREQIRHLTSQIEQLQSERSSDWAQGLSDEPPPAYQ